MALTLASVVVVQGAAVALPTQSKTARDQSAQSLHADLEVICGVVERADVIAAIESHGFSADEVHQRLAQLSPQEVHQFASQIGQLQAAGTDPPNYIWILLAVFLGVLILTAVF